MKQSHKNRLGERKTEYRWKLLIPGVALALLLVVLIAGNSASGGGTVQAQELGPQGPELGVQVVSVGEPVTPGLCPPVWSLPKVPSCGVAAALSLTKTVTPTGTVQFGDVLTYTVVVSSSSAAQVGFYDPLQGTTFERFVEQPAGVIHSAGAITGTLTVSPAQQTRIGFVVRVGVPGTVGATMDVTNRACVYPFGGTIGGCMWSNEITNPAFRPYIIHLPFIVKNN